MSDYSELPTCIKKLKSASMYALDLETTSLDVKDTSIIGVSLCMKEKKEYGNWYFKPSKEMPCDKLFSYFEPILLDTSKVCIGHNLKFDTSVLRGKDIKIFNKLADTMVMAWLVDENRSGCGRLGLKGKGSLTHELFGIILPGYSESTLSGSLFGKDEEEYALHDTLYTYKCFEALLPELKKKGLEKLFWELEMEVLPIISDMEWRGMYLDTNSLTVLDKELVNKHDEIVDKFHKLSGRRINIGSPEQLSALFFDELKWDLKEGMEKGKNGCYPTDAATLSKYAVHDNKELAQLVLEYRGVLKMLQTYVRPFKNRAKDNPESRIYGKINQTGTVTGRFCVSSDTQVATDKGFTDISKMSVGSNVLTHLGNYKPVINVIYKGRERMWTVSTFGGYRIRCTMNHQFLTDAKEWRSLKDLHFNDRIYVSDPYGHFFTERISWFTPGLEEDVWDIEVQDDHSYVGNGFVNHNSSSDPNLQNCFDDKTEILTEDGWKLFQNMTRAELVVQFDKDTEKFSLAYPNDYISKKYRGDLVSIKGDSTDLMMTPEHNCLLWDGKHGKYVDVLSRDYPEESNVFQLTGDIGEHRFSAEAEPFESMDIVPTADLEKTLKLYSGYVYCVTMPKGYIVVRRNGKISITGNCPRKKGTIKAAFKAPEGKTLVVADGSQLELRIMAHLSQDPTMLNIYRTGGDIHQTTQDAVGCKERTVSKNINFGLIYGMSPMTFQSTLWAKAGIVISIDDCKKFERAFFSKYPAIKTYHEKVNEFLRKHKYVRSLTGRRRHLADEMKRDFGSALRQAINFTVQGLGADIIKIAMRNFHREIVKKRLENNLWEDVYMLMQVHDEIVVEAPVSLAQEAADLLKHSMENAVKLSIPLIAEPKIAGPCGSWEDCK